MNDYIKLPNNLMMTFEQPNQFAPNGEWRAAFLDNDDVIASCALDLHLNEVSELFVHEKYRRRGYGSSFCKALIDTFGIDHFEVLQDNEPAIKMYEKVGCVKAKEIIDRGTYRMQYMNPLYSYISYPITYAACDSMTPEMVHRRINTKPHVLWLSYYDVNHKKVSRVIVGRVLGKIGDRIIVRIENTYIDMLKSLHHIDLTLSEHITIYTGSNIVLQI